MKFKSVMLFLVVLNFLVLKIKPAAIEGKATSSGDQLVTAVEIGDIDQVRALLEVRVDINVKDRLMGNTALTKAVSEGRREIVELLLAAGADVNIAGFCGQTALMQASARGGSVGMVNALLGAGADVNVNCGATALMFAANNSIEKVKMLLAVPGINVNATTRDGHTALMWAAIEGDVEIVEALLAAGADVNVKDKDLDTALIWAARYGIEDSGSDSDSDSCSSDDLEEKELGFVEIVEALLQANAEIPEDTSKFSEVMQDILEQQREERSDHLIKFAAKNHMPKKDQKQEDGAGGGSKEL